MAQIFISYSHRDVAQASRIAGELETRGWSVWWDPAIRSGESFIVLINREISAASCVVVLWSKASVSSHWVVEEAHNALTRDIICPVMVERDSQLPVGFATVKYVPLWEWRDGEPVGGFGPLIDELETMVGKPAPRDGPARGEEAAARDVPREQADGPMPPPVHPDPSSQRAPRGKGLPASALNERRRYVDLSDMSWMDIPVMFLLLLGIGLLAVSIFARYVLADPVSGYDVELTSILLGLAALFGAAMAERSGRNVRSPVSILLFRGRLRRLLAPLHGAFSAGIYGLVAFLMFRYAQSADRLGVTTMNTGLPLAPVHYATAAAFALLAVFSARSIVGSFRRRTVL